MASGTVPGSAMHLTRVGTKGWMSGLVRTWQRAIPVLNAPEAIYTQSAMAHEGTVTYLRLGVAHGEGKTRHILAETLSDLVLGGGGERGEEVEGADLGAPLGIALNHQEELLDNFRGELGRDEADEGLCGLLCGVFNDLGLARLLVAVEHDGEEGDEVGVGSAGEANLAEELLVRDHGRLTLTGVLGLGRAHELVQDAENGEGAKALTEHELGEARGGGAARTGVGGGEEGLEDGRRGPFRPAEPSISEWVHFFRTRATHMTATGDMEVETAGACGSERESKTSARGKSGS